MQLVMTASLREVIFGAQVVVGFTSDVASPPPSFGQPKRALHGRDFLLDATPPPVKRTSPRVAHAAARETTVYDAHAQAQSHVLTSASEPPLSLCKQYNVRTIRDLK